jgi:hypothetical protein
VVPPLELGTTLPIQKAKLSTNVSLVTGGQRETMQSMTEAEQRGQGPHLHLTFVMTESCGLSQIS